MIRICICFIWVETTTTWIHLGDMFPFLQLLWLQSHWQGKRFTRHFFLAFMESLSWYEVVWWWLMEWNTVYSLVRIMHVCAFDVMWFHAMQSNEEWVLFLKTIYSNIFKHIAYILQIYWNVPIYWNMRISSLYVFVYRHIYIYRCHNVGCQEPSVNPPFFLQDPFRGKHPKDILHHFDLESDRGYSRRGRQVVAGCQWLMY